jgi:hypothetical protein
MAKKKAKLLAWGIKNMKTGVLIPSVFFVKPNIGGPMLTASAPSQYSPVKAVRVIVQER